MELAVIAAVADHQVIGAKGQIPWYISEDLQYFKKVTLGCPVIMGRKTFESIGRPLPMRHNIVVTRQSDYHADGIDTASCLESALSLVQNCQRVFVIGGQSLYAEALPKAHQLYLTQVDLQVEGDTFFPDWKVEEWQLLSKESHRNAEDISFHFLKFQRA